MGRLRSGWRRAAGSRTCEAFHGETRTLRAPDGSLAYDPHSVTHEFLRRSRVMGIGMKELLVILAIALLVFGAKKLKTIGQDLGGAVKGFKKAMNEGDEEEDKKTADEMKKIRSDAPDAEFAESKVEKKERQA